MSDLHLPGAARADRHRARRARLAALLPSLAAEESGVDGVLITNLVNVRYLTGFTGSNGALLVTADRAVLSTDGRYTTQAGEQAGDCELVIDRAPGRALAELAGKAGLGRVGFEQNAVTVAEHAVLVEAAGAVALVPAGRPVEQLRIVKDADELEALRQACAISTRALERLRESRLLGRTERAIALELEQSMLAEGADAVGFPTIVASGPNSAIPHHEPTGRPVQAGDFLKIDFGARYRGYHADCTRTFVVGAPPAAWQAEVYELVFAAQRAGREALRAGMLARDVDAAARGVIAAAGYGEQFSHGLGHGVGLEIHEDPFLAASSDRALEPNMPITVEPGIYLPGRGGVRIEDTLVVGADAETPPELLTVTTKELLVL